MQLRSKLHNELSELMLKFYDGCVEFESMRYIEKLAFLITQILKKSAE